MRETNLILIVPINDHKKILLVIILLELLRSKFTLEAMVLLLEWSLVEQEYLCSIQYLFSSSVSGGNEEQGSCHSKTVLSQRTEI